MASRIAQLRREAGLSQEALARALDMSTKSVTRYESGEQRPSRPVRSRLARILGASEEYIEYGTIPRAPNDEAVDAPHPEVEAYLDQHPETDPADAGRLRVFFKQSAMPSVVREMIPATLKELRLQRLQAQADAPKPAGERRTMAERDAEIRARKGK